MKKLLTALFLTFVLAATAYARDANPPKPIQADETQLVEHGHYQNAAGNDVHSPAHTKSGEAPAGASAQCRDGTYSFSQSRRGTCSRHGGVGSWL